MAPCGEERPFLLISCPYIAGCLGFESLPLSPRRAAQAGVGALSPLPYPCTRFPKSETVHPRTETLLLHRIVQRFRGGLVFSAHRLCVSLNSRLESNKEEEEEDTKRCGAGAGVPLPSEYGTYTPVKAIFWPGLSGKSP